MTGNKISIPRILFAAPCSGSGKTTITCAFLEILRKRSISAVSFKCGPDYIDPMFHQYVLGVPSYNLDSFFLPSEQVRELFVQKASGSMAVIEGVMGYYDGVAGTSTWSSTYEIAGITQTPVILIVDGKTSSLSLAALVKGFMEYRPDCRIAGVILNRVSSMMEKRLRPCLEELGIRCFGLVPVDEAAKLESRHLGLTLPSQQKRLREKIGQLADLLEKTLDIDAICSLAQHAEPLCCEAKRRNEPFKAAFKRRIAIAWDEAFCFYYQENLDVLEAAGWTLDFFSPLHDKSLPGGISALLLGGGYPECYARELSENTAMLAEIRKAAHQGIRILAECGGFLYLHQSMEGMDGQIYPMTGVIDARAYRTGKLSRFGYVTLKAANCAMEKEWIRGHEFHYWDSSDPGQDMQAEKPLSSRGWPCIHRTKTMLAGFPHLYYPSNPGLIARFLDCEASGSGILDCEAGDSAEE